MKNPLKIKNKFNRLNRNIFLDMNIQKEEKRKKSRWIVSFLKGFNSLFKRNYKSQFGGSELSGKKLTNEGQAE